MSGRRYSNKRGGAFGYVCKGKKKKYLSKTTNTQKRIKTTDIQTLLNYSDVSLV
jgi:hypothetical protein